MVAHSISNKLISACLLVIFLGEMVFTTPAAAATYLPIDESGTIELLLEENAHLSCEALDVDIQIPINTLVSFSTMNKLTSKTAITGAEIPLRVAYDVVIDGKVIIPAGSMATGRVLEAKKAKIFGKPGYLSIGVESVVVDGGFIPVSGPEMTDEGDSRAAVSWVCFGVSLIILWPLIFVPFCIKGKEAEIPAGTILSAYTAGQVGQRTYTLPVATN